MSGNRMIITHTEVPDTLRGKGIAEQISYVRSEIRAERGTRSRCGMRIRKPVSQRGISAPPKVILHPD
jgi:predicted GNAT family acetyltransferase